MILSLKDLLQCTHGTAGLKGGVQLGYYSLKSQFFRSLTSSLRTVFSRLLSPSFLGLSRWGENQGRKVAALQLRGWLTSMNLTSNVSTWGLNKTLDGLQATGCRVRIHQDQHLLIPPYRDGLKPYRNLSSFLPMRKAAHTANIYRLLSLAFVWFWTVF